jgi:voltage-gated potassium channel
MFEKRIRRLEVAILLFFIIILAGSIGYTLLEETSFLDSLYMTVITVTTVGFGEVFPLSDNGKIFTIVLILVGASSAGYILSSVLEIVVAGEVRKDFRRRKMLKKISELKDHYIICGYGRMGKVICHKLKENKKVDFVVVDKNEHMEEELENKGFLYVIGDATKESVLLQAGVMSAQGLVAVTNSDAENIYIVLTAKGFNQNLKVTSRASSEEASVKMFWAGCDKTVSPYVIGGNSVADSIIKPNVSQFFELALGNSEYNIEVEEILVTGKEYFAEKKIIESNIRKEGIIIVAIKKKDGSFIYNPGPEEFIAKGDTLIALGRQTDFEKLGV